MVGSSPLLRRSFAPSRASEHGPRRWHAPVATDATVPRPDPGSGMDRVRRRPAHSCSDDAVARSLRQASEYRTCGSSAVGDARARNWVGAGLHQSSVPAWSPPRALSHMAPTLMSKRTHARHLPDHLCMSVAHRGPRVTGYLPAASHAHRGGDPLRTPSVVVRPATKALASQLSACTIGHFSTIGQDT